MTLIIIIKRILQKYKFKIFLRFEKTRVINKSKLNLHCYDIITAS